MTPEGQLLANLNSGLLGLLLLGLAYRRRHQLCWTFAGYVALVLVTDRLIIAAPDLFYTAGFWRAKETLFWTLKLAIAAEIGLLTFSSFPRARRLLVAGLVVLAAAAIIAQLVPATVKAGELKMDWLSVASPRAQASILVVMAAVLGLAAYYRIPVHVFHRGVLMGFALYLGLYTGTLTALREWGPAFYPIASSLDPAAYAATVGVWMWVAWRRVPELSAAGRRLQPWAVSR